jgi:hypothetical protein
MGGGGSPSLAGSGWGCWVLDDCRDDFDGGYGDLMHEVMKRSGDLNGRVGQGCKGDLNPNFLDEPAE